MPANCPLLKDLNLKLVNGPPTAPAPASADSPAPAASPPAASPGGRVASVDTPVSSGSGATPSGLMATDAEDEYSSDEDMFRWTGDDEGLDFGAPFGSPDKSNPSVSLYPSCFHVSVVPTASYFPSNPLPSSSSCHVLPDRLQSILLWLAASSISPDSATCVAIADTGATDHMFPDKSAFISYKRISNLQFRMGNNTFLLVLGRGTTIISLNGQRVLVRHVLHIPGLAVPLYRLQAHLKQPGCGFLGTSESGMLVYFPSFVLSVDTSSNCHLSYEPLGSSASLKSLHYVQRQCSPLLYPSELMASHNAQVFSPGPAVISGDGSSDGSTAGGDDNNFDDDGLIWVRPHMPKHVQPPSSTPLVIIPDNDSSPSLSSPSDPPHPSFDFKSVSDHLHSLANAMQDLSRPVTSTDLAVNPLPLW